MGLRTHARQEQAPEAGPWPPRQRVAPAGDTALVGFSTWLARSRLPAEPAPGYRLAIERFLRWCDSEGRHLAEHRRPWVYCRWLQRTGASESGLATARTALFLFDRYSVLGGGWDAPDPAPATPARHRLP